MIFPAGLGLAVLFAAAKVKAANDKAEQRPTGLFAIEIPGYRRARQSEVTPAMQAAAVNFLRTSPALGATLLFENFALGIEEHWRAPSSSSTRPTGRHKGVSVFVRNT